MATILIDDDPAERQFAALGTGDPQPLPVGDALDCLPQMRC